MNNSLHTLHFCTKLTYPRTIHRNFLLLRYCTFRLLYSKDFQQNNPIKLQLLWNQKWKILSSHLDHRNATPITFFFRNFILKNFYQCSSSWTILYGITLCIYHLSQDRRVISLVCRHQTKNRDACIDFHTTRENCAALQNHMHLRLLVSKNTFLMYKF